VQKRFNVKNEIFPKALQFELYNCPCTPTSYAYDQK